MIFSTINLDKFFNPENLRELLIKQALLDLILSPEQGYLYHFFTSSWGKDLDLAEINDGSGNNLFVVFSQHGVIMKGFDHELEMRPYVRDDFSIWPGIYDEVPTLLLQILDNDSLEKSAVTFCIWRESSDNEWNTGNVQFCNLTNEFPLPKVDNTKFYIITTSGILTAEGREEDFGENRHRLSPLFHIAHELIFQIRIIDEKYSVEQSNQTEP